MGVLAIDLPGEPEPAIETRDRAMNGSPMSTVPAAVLAALTECAGAPAEGWCLGLFNGAHEGFALGQQAALDSLCAQVPHTPRRVLLAGAAARALSTRLQALGHTVRVLASSGGDVDPATVPPGAGSFDLLLCAGLAGRFDPMQLLAAADGLLVPQHAELLWLDEFSLSRQPAGTEGLQHLPLLLSLAERQGWKVLQQQPMPAAVCSWARVETLLHQHRSRLADELQLDDEAWAACRAAMHQRRAHHGEGTWGFVQLQLQRPERVSDAIARVGPGQAKAMRELFANVFGHAMDEREWHWKYGQGRGRAVGLWKDGQMLAHFGALTRPVMLRGRPGMACQLGDVMVSPKANAGLGRQGVFYRLGASLLEVEIGWGLRHEIGFGFPSARHMRVAERVKLYAHADEVAWLQWTTANVADGADLSVAPALPHEAAWSAEPVDLSALQEGSPLWAELDAAWHAMAAALPEAVIGLRDPAWLRHRYGRRPNVHYEGLAVREAGALLGLVVLRTHGDHVELMDLIGPPAHLQGFVRQARRHALVAGHTRLDTWVTRSHRHWLEDPASPAAEQPLGVTVPANSHTPGIGPEDLQACWFLMSGDTDFR